MRLFLVALATSLIAVSAAHAQVRERTFPYPAASQPTYGEHADGGEIPVVIGGLSLLSLVTYDIATAPASARWHNGTRPATSQRSPATALLLSLGGTVIPVAAGGLLVDRGSGGGTDLSAVGAGLILAGLSVGPAAGHLYAGRRARAWQNAGVRAGLLVAVGLLEQCCT